MAGADVDVQIETAVREIASHFAYDNAEHDEPWPGGRSNHYLFDMNRDWFAQSQPETRGRLRIAREYWPHVNVDLHEQGGDNTYYFAPPADPLNPHITPNQIAAFDLFGRANAARFDERGWPYFIREVYDAFYPGYGELCARLLRRAPHICLFVNLVNAPALAVYRRLGFVERSPWASAFQVRHSR